MKRERWACMICPAGYVATGREKLDCGKEEIVLDGRKLTVLVPGKDGKKKTEPYCYYCRVTGRKIGHKACWTGLLPKWCPRLEEEK